MPRVTKTNLQRAINRSGMSTAEKKALTNIIDSAPASFWGQAGAAALTANDDTLANTVIRLGQVEAALVANGILAA